MRDCENCKHHTDNGCSSWECEFEPTTKNDLVTLTFSKGTLKYSCKDYVVYKKDWLRSHYGAEIDIMFGDSQYKEPTTKNDLGVDCISRADARKAIIDHQYSDSFCEGHNIDHSINTGMALIALSDLPSVTPQEPRKGHWRPIYQGDEIIDYRCSKCEFGNTFGKSTHGMNYCPNCGSDMRGEE